MFKKERRRLYLNNFVCSSPNDDLWCNDPFDGASTGMVTRGGDWFNWDNLSLFLSSAGRLSDNQDIRLQRLGFRLRKLNIDP
jgi:formylglycine-generating enzyme required for sulfatase activity